MIRFKYKLFEGRSPYDEIINVFPLLTWGDMRLGAYPDGDWLLGEVDLDASNESAFMDALLDFEATVLTEQQTLSYIESVSPPRVAQPKITLGAAFIDEGGWVGQYATEDWS